MYIRQNRLPNEVHNKRQRRTLHNKKGLIQQEDLTLVNMNAPTIEAPNDLKKI